MGRLSQAKQDQVQKIAADQEVIQGVEALLYGGARQSREVIEENAACKGLGQDIFFQDENTDEALRICDGCDVQFACGVLALAQTEHFGVAGGLEQGVIRAAGRLIRQNLAEAHKQ